jgi:hypothetical protein
MSEEQAPKRRKTQDQQDQDQDFVGLEEMSEPWKSLIKNNSNLGKEILIIYDESDRIDARLVQINWPTQEKIDQVEPLPVNINKDIKLTIESSIINADKNIKSTTQTVQSQPIDVSTLQVNRDMMRPRVIAMVTDQSKLASHLNGKYCLDLLHTAGRQFSTLHGLSNHHRDMGWSFFPEVFHSTCVQSPSFLEK